MKARDLRLATTRLLKGYIIENEKAHADEPVLRALTSAFLLSGISNPDIVNKALIDNSDVFILAVENDHGIDFINKDYPVGLEQIEGVALYYNRSDAEHHAHQMGRHIMVMTLTQVMEF